MTNLLQSQVPVALPGLANVKQIAGSGNFWCALLSTGGVQCWGNNMYGQLGNGTTSSPMAQPSGPVAVTGVTNAVQIVAGSNFACALDNTGTVKCWGANSNGELGNGTTTSSSTPVVVGQGFSKLASGFSFTCGIYTSGGVGCWGSNSNGQLGTGTTTNMTSPSNVVGLNATVNLVAGAMHTCAQRADGTVRCWGLNGWGQLGNGSLNQSLTAVPASISGVTMLAASMYSTCARNQNGVYCWGYNFDGELGDGTGNNSASPVLVSALSGTQVASLVSSGTANAYCATLANQTIECWGQNAFGSLGNGTQNNEFVPTPVLMQ
jgi:alpha-tubulin suppressor-like RCC1 family protein